MLELFDDSSVFLNCIGNQKKFSRINLRPNSLADLSRENELNCAPPMSL